MKAHTFKKLVSKRSHSELQQAHIKPHVRNSPARIISMEETIQNKIVIKTNNLVVLSVLPQLSLSNESQGFITQTQEFGLG